MPVCIGSVRWPPELYAKIKDEADKSHISLNKFVIRIVAEYFGLTVDAGN